MRMRLVATNIFHILTSSSNIAEVSFKAIAQTIDASARLDQTTM